MYVRSCKIGHLYRCPAISVSPPLSDPSSIDTGLAHLSDAQPDFIYGLYINVMQFLLPCPPPPLLTHKGL